MGVQREQIYAHVTTKTLTHQHAKCDNHWRECDKDVTKIVETELKEQLGVQSIPVLSKPMVKRPQIEGLKVFKEFFICDYDGCSSGFSSNDSLRVHRSKIHKNPTVKPKRGTRRMGHCQTLYMNPPTYFEVDPISPPTSPLPSRPTFDLSAFLHNRKAEILHKQDQKHPPTNPKLIPPVFVELGFYTFIESLDLSYITGYMKCKGDNQFSLLRKLAVQCFEEDCIMLVPAHNSIREGIMEAPLWYFFLTSASHIS